MPPASAVNNNSNNAALQAAKAERAEKLRGAIRGFIVEDRQRRQEEYEARCEELRRQREREARERETTISLDDTREEISKLDEQIADLHSQKHQLVVQLKKVLNDDETRKKQIQIKENELFVMQQAMQQAAASVAATQVFLPPVRLQHHQLPIIQKPLSGSQPTKRGRSPSPPSQHQAYYKSAPSYAQQKHDDYRRAADYARLSWNQSTTQYPGTATLFYQTTAAPPTTQHQTDARLQSIYNYGLRPAYHLELQTGPGPSATISKAPESQAQKAQSMQVLHVNLDQPPISQSDLLVQAGSSLSVQASKPQVTMEKLPERYHIEVKHDGTTGQLPPPPHLLSESVLYKPLLSDLVLHPNVLQISSNPAPNPKATGSITQGYAPGRGGAAHEQQISRQQQQQQLSMVPGQPTATGAAQPPPGQQVHYSRRLY